MIKFRLDSCKQGFFENCTSDPAKAPEARMRMWVALQQCKEVGKIRHLGVSNFARKHIEGMVKDSRLVGSCHGG